MKVKVAEATNTQLDWMVAKCEGFTEYDPVTEKMLPPRKECGWVSLCDYNYSTDWAQGGPIIEREGIDLHSPRPHSPRPHWRHWKAYTPRWTHQSGPTPLIAAMRCFIASKLGDEVEVPNELA